MSIGLIGISKIVLYEMVRWWDGEMVSDGMKKMLNIVNYI
jgi:hypothetical protein